MFLADFHLHSTFSDGKLTIPELVDFFGSRGFGAIAITDHLCESKSVIGQFARLLNRTLTPENFSKYLLVIKEESERAWEQYRMVLIPGYELTKNSPNNHRSAHLLALGVTEFIHADGDAVDLAHAIKRSGALAIAAHPVSTRKLEKQTYMLWNRRRELEDILDAWEVASGPYIFDEVKESGYPMIANSDLHAAKQITSWKTALSCERHPEAILSAIREQKLDFQFYRDPQKVDMSSPLAHQKTGY